MEGARSAAGPLQGVPFPPCSPQPWGPTWWDRALCSAGRKVGAAWAPAANPPPDTSILGGPGPPPSWTQLTVVAEAPPP